MEHCAIRTLTSTFPTSSEERRQTSQGQQSGPCDVCSSSAHDQRHAFLPAIASTSGRIYGELLRLLYLLSDKKTTRFLQGLGEAVDVSSEVDRWRRRSFSGTYGLLSACAQATILCTQVVGHPHRRSVRAPVHDPGLVGHAPVRRCIRHHPLGLGLCLSLQWMKQFLFICPLIQRPKCT